MTRTAANNFSGGNPFQPNTRPSKELLPAPVIAALAAYDDLIDRHHKARLEATDLNNSTTMEQAQHKDNAAAAAAIAANKPIPAPEATAALIKEREDSGRVMLAFTTAITDAENNLRNLTAKTAKDYDADKEHAAMVSEVQGHLDKAAESFQKFADHEALNAWMTGSALFVPRTAITVTDIIALERPRTMDGRTNVPLPEILNGVINALRNGK
jgi:hypothetical protein